MGSKKPAVWLACLILPGLILATAGCAKPTTGAPGGADSNSATAPAVAPAQPPVQAPVQKPPVEPGPIKARILAIGDLNPHVPIVEAAQTGEKQWDFTPVFAHVRPWLEGADLTIGDLETTFVGDTYPWSGYPSFNSPTEFVRDLKAVGVDAVTNANNHALDYDGPGLIKTANEIDRFGMPHTGTSRTAEERDKILVLDVAPGLKLALLSYTYATNGIPLPEPWMVNMLDPYQIRTDIRRARQLPGVDLVAVAYHFGDEYAREPNEEQEMYVQLALEAGADMILGDHVHVLQRMEVRQVKDEFGRDRRRAVAFCMGNFVSAQQGLHRQESIMMAVDVKKENGETTIEQVSFVPTWMHQYTVNGQKRFRTLVVEKAIKEYEAGADPLITAADYAQLKEAWADITTHVKGSPEVAILHVDSPVSVSGGK
ncbi:MAG TPA: CapA family protein [Symbiobacteriaceae bacterium]|nr:CapA family protein [Symbiobacteriaceae bacterium]